MKHLLSSALIAGFAAGLLCALLQYLLVEPQILLAERYESGELSYFQAAASDTSTAHDHAATEAIPAAHDHDHGDAAPMSDLTRHAYTVLFAALTYAGYGLILVAGINVAEHFGHRISRPEALLWGLAGFLCFQMMPALGLEPELPGTPAADLDARQYWWALTAVATAVGLALIFYGKGVAPKAVGVIALILPHLIGAPKLDGFGGVVPPELASAFTARSLGVGLITWLVLGGVAQALWRGRAQ